MSEVNYEVLHEEGHRPIKAWIRGVQLEEAAAKQLLNLSSLPFIHHHIAAMPDVHWGMGATVGSVVPTKGAIIPAAVGVDIGCGMMARRLNLRAKDLPDNLHDLRTAIELRVPHGRTDNGGANDRGAWKETSPHLLDADRVILQEGLRSIVEKYPEIERAAGRFQNHAGTLGTGNHFIEVCLDEEDRVWVMLHSGSRGIGNRIGTVFIDRAKRDMERWFINLPDRDLAYIVEGSELFDDYVEAVGWAQDFARLNRELMMDAVMDAFRSQFPDLTITDSEEAVNCHHNYIERENHFGSNVWVTRKGAVRARKGDLGIIPGSMGTRSYIVQGLGNPDSFCSCSHGAGRRMSRAEARRTFTVEDHIRATEGIECRKDEDVIDETPAAYKDIDAVMEAQRDLVEVKHTLHQVLCVKG